MAIELGIPNANVLYIIGALIVFTIVLIYLTKKYVYDANLKGFWKADPEFCKKAELEMFMLYLGDNISQIGHKRNSYWLAATDSGVILNNPAKLSFSASMSHSYDVSIDWLDSPPDDENAFPTECSLVYYPKYSKLVFYQNDEVLVILWKDNQMSSVAASESLLPKATMGELIGQDDQTTQDVQDDQNDQNDQDESQPGAE